jgi:membrane-associated phospholipid phosphatase
VFLAAVPVILSLCRRLPIVALAIVGIIAGAAVTTELLKPLLATQLQAGGPVALAGAAFVASVAGSVVMLGWHYPSDVVGGVLVASAWWLLGIGAFAELRRPRLARRRVHIGEGALADSS